MLIVLRNHICWGLLIILCSFSALVSANQGEAWTQIIQVKVDHPSALAGFYDENYGITIGNAGHIRVTRDGGRTWKQAQNSSRCRFGLEILDNATAWHCGNGGQVRRSSDGGETWEALKNFGYNEPEHCQYLSFVDEKTGWIASPYYQLGRTTDGGNTWTEMEIPDSMKETLAISLFTADDGYLLDNSGTLYFTSDGGERFVKRSVVLNDGRTLLQFAPQTAMRFVDAKNGIIVSSRRGGELISLVTEDGGLKWKTEKVPAKVGALFLSRDGRYLTIMNNVDSTVTVLRRMK